MNRFWDFLYRHVPEYITPFNLSKINAVTYLNRLRWPKARKIITRHIRLSRQIQIQIKARQTANIIRSGQSNLITHSSAGCFAAGLRASKAVKAVCGLLTRPMHDLCFFSFYIDVTERCTKEVYGKPDKVTLRLFIDKRGMYIIGYNEFYNLALPRCWWLQNLIWRHNYKIHFSFLSHFFRVWLQSLQKVSIW